MAYPRRSSANPYRITLDLDPITSDALTQAAKARTKGDRTRLAYELIQYGLGIGMSTPPLAVAPPEDDHLSQSVRRGLAAIDNLNRPKGSA